MKKVLLLTSTLLLLLAGAMFVVSCSDDDEVDPLLLNEWVLVSYGNESNEVLKEAKGYYYIMTFHSDGTYSGNIYGNKMGGEYSCNGNRITISNPKRTLFQMEGTDPDRFFLAHIDEVCSYVATNTELRLYYSDNQYFKFRINIK